VRVAVLLVLLLLALTAVALAAGGLLSGSPVKAPYRLIPTSGSGVPIASSVELTALSVADPAGGPPWGLRAMKTTRGLGCLQFGRLVEGRLSVLGQDGAFGDDRRFHELPADVFDDLGCATLDAHGNLFVAVSRQGVPASAYEEGCSPPVHGIVPAPGQPTCQAKDERALYYGALGPDAESITYATFGGRSITVPTVGPEGAYLIVTYAPPHADPNVFGAGSPNGSAILPSGSRQPIRAIAYRNGTVCHIGAHADLETHGRRCAPVGFAAAPASTANVRAPLSVSVHYNVPEPHLGHERAVAFVSFTTGQAVTRAGEYYAAHLQFPCHGDSETSEIPHDVSAGATVTIKLGLSTGPPGSEPCAGTYKGKVTYVAQPDFSSQSRGLPATGGDTVGEFSIRLPEHPGT
jgi:hypothetical protein